MFPPALRRISFEDPDYDLLDAAVLYETNRIRATRGRPPLAFSPLLQISARAHAHEMARLGFFSHVDPFDPDRRIPQQRMALVGVDRGVRAENIADIIGLAFTSGELIIPPRKSGDPFLYENGGGPIPARTYLDLARQVVDEWMHSQRHRDNILEPRLRYMGSGCAVYSRSSFHGLPCVKFVQNFASEVPPRGMP